jgi:hypothetical protein
VFGPQPGGYVGTCLLALATVWSVISALDLWESDLSLNFPVNVNDSLSHAQLITSLKGIAHNALLVSIHSHCFVWSLCVTRLESGYVLFTNVVMLLLLYKFIYFLQFRPITRLLSKSQFGTKFHYRYLLALSVSLAHSSHSLSH